MAKKFGKFLLFTAAVGAVVAGTYYYLQNKTARIEEDDDDFDDFDEYEDDDFEEGEDDAGRSYVSLDLENTDSAAPEQKANEANAPAQQESASKTEDKVEEFFDDEDPSLDAM